MNIGLNLKLQLAYTALVAALTVAGTATAQNLPKEGNYDFTSCWSGVSNPIIFSKTHSATASEMTGTTRSAQPGDMFDKNSFRCVLLATSFDGKASGISVCEVVDRDGDRRLTRYLTASDGKMSRETIAGTGKYDGMVTSDTVTPLGPFPVIKAGTFQNCNRTTGTYKLK